MGREPLWCEDCGKSHMGDCPVHGPLLKVRDKVIPTRARLTLPHYLMLKELELRTANQQVLGVFARKLIQQRTQFGPFIAPRVPKLEIVPPDNKLIFKVFKNKTEVSTLDLSNENACSWMMFVRTATTFEEQNLVAYQFNQEIYFATCKPVAPHAELKVWYASDYAGIMNVELLHTDIPDNSPIDHSSSSISKLQVSDDATNIDVKQTTQDKNNNKISRNSCEPWKCSNCNKMFGTFFLLEQHSCESKKAKRGQKPNKHLRRKLNARESHLRKHKDQEMKQVAQVKELTQVKNEVIQGCSKPKVRKDHVTYACHLCPKVFLNSDKLKTHSYIHTGERPFPCTSKDCTKAFISKYKLLRHVTTHSPMKVHICSYCDKKFHRKDHLKNHLQTHDPNKISFRCGDCGKMYNTKPGFKKHIALHAAASGELTCKICDKDFGNTQSLLEHIKLHSGKSNGAKEKRHRCEHCDRQFYTRKDVRRHMVVHTGRKDFLCQACGQRFGRKDHLVRHTRKSHDSSEQLRVKLGEHLQTVGSATVQQMLDMQQFQGQIHIPLPQGNQCSIGQMTSSHQLTDLLKIPPVPTPRFSNKTAQKVSSPKAPVRLMIEKTTVDTYLDSGNLKGISGADSFHSGSVDLGQLLGFLPIQQHSPIPPPTPPQTLTPTSPPNTLPHSPITICLPQHQQSQQPLHPQMQHQSQQQLQTMQSPCTDNIHSMVQVPFTNMHSALPRFHQAFQ
ncbi:zinc finger protein PLAG1-like isoform X2 [Asterias rubens]|uniref:zinc finger protein PLAG1-like isoform X2 n=1 Tax=Asterias rubens TaxID=7604 RepID=UPI0014551870|nr:zinc finger protein PLAG1-like isoform X2 [Asterias rubens]